MTTVVGLDSVVTDGSNSESIPIMAGAYELEITVQTDSLTP